MKQKEASGLEEFYMLQMMMREEGCDVRMALSIDGKEKRPSIDWIGHDLTWTDGYVRQAIVMCEGAAKPREGRDGRKESTPLSLMPTRLAAPMRTPR